ncbi:MAG: methyltransferase domain-containing protein [Candidatus Coatesbacteria bacterium]|nr:methyltransferase domain-containing protein [Candidatus Coatesbacteria bacterium]
MALPNGIRPGWWKKELDRLGEGTLYAPWAKPEITRREVGFLVDVLGVGAGRSLLDAGCGFGRHSLLLAVAGFRVIGVDVSHILPRLGRKCAASSGIRAEFSTADVAALPFAEGSFGCVIVMAEGGLGYQETDMANERMLSELSRVLTPGGKFVIGVINAGWAASHCPCHKYQLDGGGAAFYRFFFDAKESRLTTDVHSYRWREHKFHHSRGWVRLYTRDELTSLLARSGLDVTIALGDNSMDRPYQSDSFRMVLCGEKRGWV